MSRTHSAKRTRSTYRRRHRSRPVRLLVPTAALLAVVGGPLAGCGGDGNDRPTPAATVTATATVTETVTQTVTETATVTAMPPWAVITGPRAGDVVADRQFVQGVALGIPRGDFLWALVRPDSVDRYYPVSTRLQPDPQGRWQAYAGFSLVVATATPEGDLAIRHYLNQGTGAGLPSLPNGVRELTRVEVKHR